MGDPAVNQFQSQECLRIFMKRLLTDLRALEKLLADGRIEEGVRRIGVEQELFLVDRFWRPSPTAPQVLNRLNDARFTHELAKFNLELNLEPMLFGGSCLRQLETNLNAMLELVYEAAALEEVSVMMIGILPTLHISDLTLENMTPLSRYHALNDAVSRLRGSNRYDLRVVGIDELSVTHDSIMIESCNTSFQIHFQVGRDEFVDFYNIGQAVAGPALAASTNSPILFGKRLWEETRIALFQQALETRESIGEAVDRHSRVTFGTKWVEQSVIEIFQEDIARMRVLLGGETGDDPFTEIDQGKIPALRALQLHNGTVYRWLRPCYGITNGVPHLRIENRFLPSGPTVIDETANAALWFGLISGLRKEYGDITKVLDFDFAKSNFIAAARHGLSAQFHWIGGKTIPAHDLLLDELIPLARHGLVVSGIDSEDIDRYLGIIEERVKADTTGARWMLKSVTALKGKGSQRERVCSITASCLRHQREGKPVHTWPEATFEDMGGWESNYLRAEQYMATDVFTVHQDELIDLVACMMDWAQIRHIPVEDDEHHLVGLVSYRSLLRLIAQGRENGRENETVAVKTIMNPNPITIAPETKTLEVIQLMKEKGVACLPVVRDGRLLGMVTERSLIGVAADVLEEKLRGL